MVQYRIIEDIAEFEKTLPVWEKMLADTPVDTIFLTHPYIRVWWKHFGKDRRLFIVLIEDSGKLVAAAPFCILHRRFFGLTFRIMEIIGSGPVPSRPMGLSDRSVLPVRPDREDALEKIYEILMTHRSRWDIIYLRGIHFTEQFSCEEFKHWFASRGQTVFSRPRYRSPYLPISGTFESYKRHRSGNFRKQLARYKRKLLERGAVEIEPGEAMLPDDLMKEIYDLVLQSPKGVRGTALFLDRQLRCFFRDIFSAFQKRGWLWARFLKSGDKRIAYEICFHYDNKLFSYNSCYDRNYRNISPGVLLTASIVEEAFSSGLSEYDMLRGEEPYKKRWSSTAREEFEVAIGPGTLRCRLFIAFQMRLKPWVKTHGNLARFYERVRLWCRKLFTKKSVYPADGP